MADKIDEAGTDKESMEINDEEDMSADDSDGDDNEEDNREEKLKIQIQEYKSQLLENPFMYDAHVNIIKTARELGDLETLRSAREKMCELFPLSEDIWLPWLQDEAGLVSDETSRENVRQLFEKAVKDYLSVPVWLEYVQFSIGGMGEADGVKKVRDTFECALTACGLHVTKGGNLWEAFREFENAILAGLLPAAGSVPSKEQERKFTEQHDRVEALFKRQISVPLQALEETLQEYEDWLQGQADKVVKQTFNKALIKLEKIRPYEKKLAAVSPPRLEEYQEYISYEEKEGDPARIQCLYERAIQENCLNTHLWLQYTKYLDHKLQVPSLSIGVYKRGVRNCPWCAQLWQNYLLTLERAQQPFKQVKGVFEAALLSGFSQGSEYLLLWTTFLDYLRRRIKWDQDYEEDLETFRLSIEKAVEQLDGFGAEGDPNGILRQTWAIVEVKHCKNHEKARELWAEIMAAGRANEAALWLENYRFERQFGDAKHCRKVLQRALNSVSDWPESIVDAFINFERLEGTFEQYEQAVAKCEAQMARIRERREKESAQHDQPRHDKKGQKKGFERKGGQKGKKQFEKPQQKSQNQNKPNKRKGEGDTPSEIKNIQPYKRKNESMDTPEEGFKVPLPVAAKFTKSAPPPGYKGAGEVVQPETPPSNGDQAAPPATEGSSKVVPTPGVKRPLEKSAPPPGYRADKEQDQEPPEKKIKTDSEAKVQFSEQANYTIFVSNLNYKVDEDNIRDFFKKCGQIEEIRLIKNFKGQSKGYGYVQFADQLSVSNALAYDRTAMEGRPMYVSRYEERGETKSKADFKYPTSMEKNKLFVKNLPFTCTEEALKTLFSQYGELKGVRLVTYRSGASKGLAYIEYVDEQTASQALLKTDGLQVGEHTIEVAISNPPARKAQFSQREETSFVPTLGGGKKETLSRGVARTQVMLMPRSVSKKPISSKPSPGSSQNKDTNASDTGNKTGMSNSDFRNMLLKK